MGCVQSQHMGRCEEREDIASPSSTAQAHCTAKIQESESRGRCLVMRKTPLKTCDVHADSIKKQTELPVSDVDTINEASSSQQSPADLSMVSLQDLAALRGSGLEGPQASKKREGRRSMEELPRNQPKVSKKPIMITPPPPGGFFLATLPALKEEGDFLEPPTTADYESLGDLDKSVNKRSCKTAPGTI